MHEINIKDYNLQEPADLEKIKGQKYMLDLICHHNVTPKAFDKCFFFQSAYECLNLVKPNSIALILEEVSSYKAELRVEIEKKKRNCEVFGLSFHLIKTISGRSFINLNLHYEKQTVKNIGLIMIRSPRMDLKTEFYKKLKEYDLNF